MPVLSTVNIACILVSTLIRLTITLNCNDLTYSEELSLRGRASIEPPLGTITASSPTECVVKCEETIQCVSIFYDTINNTCSLYNLTLQQHSTTSQPGYVCYQTDDMIQSWVLQTISATSTHYSDTVHDVVGPPDNNGWSHDNTNPSDIITLQFPSAMYIEGITVYEISYPEGVIDIKLLTPQGAWYTVWSTDTTDSITGERTWTPDIKVSHFRTAFVQIHTQQRPSIWEEIDAVQITGRLNRIGVRMKSYI